MKSLSKIFTVITSQPRAHIMGISIAVAVLSGAGIYTLNTQQNYSAEQSVLGESVEVEVAAEASAGATLTPEQAEDGMQAITSASESDTLVPSSQEAQSDTGSKTTSNKSTDTTDSDTESTTNKPSAETVTPEASAPSATPTPTPAATTTTTTQSVQAANTPATPTPTPTPTPQPEAVRSKVYIKAYYHPGNSDEVVPNAPVRFKNKNTGEVFTGFTNSSGKSPEFKFPMNTDVEVTLYSPRDWNTEYCGSTWTVNTGSYGSTKAENMRLFASASPCITE